MAAMQYPSWGDYTSVTTASVVFYVDVKSTASTWPVYAPVAEFIPGRRQPVWEDEPRAAKSFVVKQHAAKCYVLHQKRNAPSSCQLRRQKRKNRLQSLS